ncbi:MAG: PRC-barrel domain-containing protein [Acidimicrobiales bacterium]
MPSGTPAAAPDPEGATTEDWNIGKEVLAVGSLDFTLGAEVVCEDGECGELERLVVDSAEDAVTHLVVGTRHAASRLVPADLVDTTAPHSIRLRCTLAQFGAFAPAEEVEIRPGLRRDVEPTMGTIRAAARVGAMVKNPDGLANPDVDPPLGLTRERRAFDVDKLDAGEGEVWHGQQVHTSDGPVGHVDGLVADPRHGVSYILLQEGHLWGEKEVAIPAGAIKFVVDDGVYLNLTKEEVGKLPPVDLARLE